MTFFIILLLLTFAPITASWQDDATSVTLPATKELAYVEELDSIQILTRFRDRNGNSHRAPVAARLLSKTKEAQVPERFWVEFDTDTVIGHGDLEKQVRCMLIRVKGKQASYGVYGLRDDKSKLRMQYPGHRLSVIWDNVSAGAAIERTLIGVGIPKKRAKEILADHEEEWLAPGDRAIMAYQAAPENRNKIVLAIYECLER